MTKMPFVRSAAALAALAVALPAVAQDSSQDSAESGSSSMPVLLPPVDEFLSGLEGAPPINSLEPEAARQVLIDTQTGADVPMPDADVEEMTLDVGPTGQVTVHVVRPADSDDDDLPGVVYFHGGGWILGNFTTHERLMRDMANRTEAAFVFVEYAPSPEEQHPVALEQDLAVLQYVAENGAEMGIDSSRLALAGDSVGGHMTAVVPMMAAETGNAPDLAALVMFYPVTTAELDSETYETFSDGPWLTRAAMEWFWNAYLPEDADTSDPMISPLMADADTFADYPPTLVITDENDVLRAEGEAFAELLTEAGVEVTSTRYNETIHDFVMLNPLAGSTATEAAIDQAADFLGEHLSDDD